VSGAARTAVAHAGSVAARALLVTLGLLAMFFAAPTAGAAEAYRLGSGDRVRVVVFGHDDLSGEFEVDDTGRVSLPLVGPVEAAGATAAELETRLAGALRPDYLLDPHVTVEVVGYRPIFILGEVENPGSYPYASGLTVVNAVALAGGYTYRASKRRVTIVRADDPQKTKERVEETAPVAPGDVIEVPERHF
jgi:protein involved in polysaccharide export with SLBB domain